MNPVGFVSDAFSNKVAWQSDLQSGVQSSTAGRRSYSQYLMLTVCFVLMDMHCYMDQIKPYLIRLPRTITDRQISNGRSFQFPPLPEQLMRLRSYETTHKQMPIIVRPRTSFGSFLYNLQGNKHFALVTGTICGYSAVHRPEGGLRVRRLQQGCWTNTCSRSRKYAHTALHVTMSLIKVAQSVRSLRAGSSPAASMTPVPPQQWRAGVTRIR
jgi:hypothetical protein